MPPADKINVVLPAVEVKSERCRNSPCPHACANAIARTSTASLPSSWSSPSSNKSLAACMKSFAAPLCTARTFSQTIFAAAFAISAGCGGPIRTNRKPPFRSIFGIAHSFLGVSSVTQIPVAPARPVRPER